VKSGGWWMVVGEWNRRNSRLHHPPSTISILLSST
jgi:hypothetical protein